MYEGQNHSFTHESDNHQRAIAKNVIVIRSLTFYSMKQKGQKKHCQ